MEDSPNLKGNVAELKIAAEAVRLGVDVLRPMTEHGRYDLVFELQGRLLRVQCKWGRLRADTVAVHTSANRLTPAGYVRTPYGEDEIDSLAVYCGKLDSCYLLPAALVAGKHQIRLRLTPPKNGQRAGLNWAADYELSGAIAQLGERRHGMAEVVGSSPTSSTRAATVVGAHEFRTRFGWYMERAAAGETFEVTRRGKPYVRLTRPEEPSALSAAA